MCSHWGLDSLMADAVLCLEKPKARASSSLMCLIRRPPLPSKVRILIKLACAALELPAELSISFSAPSEHQELHQALHSGLLHHYCYPFYRTPDLDLHASKERPVMFCEGINDISRPYSNKTKEKKKTHQSLKWTTI